jgi:hypothetical protein
MIIVNDSVGNRVALRVAGDIEDIDVLSATYVDSNLDVSDEELDFILATYFSDIEVELINNLAMYEMEER